MPRSISLPQPSSASGSRIVLCPPPTSSNDPLCDGRIVLPVPTGLSGSGLRITSPLKRKRIVSSERRRRVTPMKPIQGRHHETVQSNDLEAIPNINPANDMETGGASENMGETYSRYDSYVELVLAYGIGFCPIAPELFVVQGWDMRLGIGTVRPKEWIICIGI